MNTDEVFKLLSIEEKSRNHPNLKAIHDNVLAQLSKAAVAVAKENAEAARVVKQTDMEEKLHKPALKPEEHPTKTSLFPGLNLPKPGDE